MIITMPVPCRLDSLALLSSVDIYIMTSVYMHSTEEKNDLDLGVM